MLRIGVHVSITGSIDKAVERAVERGCNTFQIFTRSPRGWKFTAIPEENVSLFIEKYKEANITPVVAHMPYLPNLATSQSENYSKSLDTLISEIQRCEQLKIPYLVTHLGSHLGEGYEIGLKNILNAIDQALSQVDNKVMLLLENTAGTKNSMGSTFEEIQAIIEGLTHHQERIGICFDTAHGFAAGYDLRTEEAVQDTITKLDDIIGLKMLKVIHANDSKGDLASHIDRHEHIGLGYIGDAGFRALLHHKSLQDLPFIMETPIDDRQDDIGNIQKLRELAG
ncbi:MAG: deoxyribonuclease IV [Candidatus Heimdallarchaeota archaeon]